MSKHVYVANKQVKDKDVSLSCCSAVCAAPVGVYYEHTEGFIGKGAQSVSLCFVR